MRVCKTLCKNCVKTKQSPNSLILSAILLNMLHNHARIAARARLCPSAIRKVITVSTAASRVRCPVRKQVAERHQKRHHTRECVCLLYDIIAGIWLGRLGPVSFLSRAPLWLCSPLASKLFRFVFITRPIIIIPCCCFLVFARSCGVFLPLMPQHDKNFCFVSAMQVIFITLCVSHNG